MDTWNLEYVSRGLSTHETVLIDTSSMLNPNIGKFIENYKSQFLEQQRKIIVKKVIIC